MDMPATLLWNKYLKLEDHWLEEERGYLIMAATLTATVAFQAGINPPGSVWQEKEDEQKAEYIEEPGVSIFATIYSVEYYKGFLRYNTISLVSSLVIILLMISGFPLTNKIALWLLTMAMSTKLIFMAKPGTRFTARYGRVARCVWHGENNNLYFDRSVCICFADSNSSHLGVSAAQVTNCKIALARSARSGEFHESSLRDPTIDDGDDCFPLRFSDEGEVG
ncbi:hypothetical protein F0562_024179 [Nyssa sinensis]|uniref:PGG domain-containing protein n=1 Tax=Nyssa sinensis TaxID=561372 RepID=A0A5J5BC69_9ASTE|nr:hypothetical protein F0562_024179 [Nyssa sinensis]